MKKEIIKSIDTDKVVGNSLKQIVEDIISFDLKLNEDMEKIIRDSSIIDEYDEQW